jgi:hypothetical protein
MERSAPGVTRAEATAAIAAMTDVQLLYAVEVLGIIRRVGTVLPPLLQGASIEVSIANYIAERWPKLVVDAVYTKTKWQRDDLIRILHHLIRRARDDEDFELEETDRLAFEVMSVAASFLLTGVVARGRPVRKGDTKTARRVRLAHDALYGKTADAKGIREVVGIIDESKDAVLVRQRLIRLNEAFEAVEPARLAELLASYTEETPKKGSGLRTRDKIVATILVDVGIYGARRRKPNETKKDLEDRIEDMRRRIGRALKKD